MGEALKASKRILSLRGQRVLLSDNLAELYGIEPRVLIQAVKRNASRFPPDFMFRLSAEEVDNLKSQFVISRSARHGGKRHTPYAFTEQGVAMLSSVLRSPRAIAVNLEIMRTFVRLRQWLLGSKELAQKLKDLETKVDGQHRTVNSQLRIVFEALEGLISPPPKPRRQIGFKR